MNIWHDFPGPNAAYVIELYERYVQNPQAVDPQTRAFFEQWQPAAMEAPPAILTAGESLLQGEAATQKIVGAANLAEAIRRFGHLAARIDPLDSPRPGDPSLDPVAHDITEQDLVELPSSVVGAPIAASTSNALKAIQVLRKIYCSSIGYDYDHIGIPEEREWLRHIAESGRLRPPQDPINPQAILQRLTQVECFEQFLQRTFPGKTRFSIEGLDTMLLILDEVIGEAAEADCRAILIGMAHRGRLNILTHILNKPYAQILAEFKDPVKRSNLAASDNLGWTGDVKYHMGARRALRNGKVVDLVVSMASNPSHLEYVNPVVEGMARAADTLTDRPGPPRLDSAESFPILIHGDASFVAQGVVAETLNLAQLPGYSTDGTIHIIANNQLGFTTPAEEGRSTLYASDLAKGFKIPIVHVNADDPEACIEVARLAYAYRRRFGKDFLIDLVGYRRYGHNEGDEPEFTQPKMYQLIEQHPPVRQLWGEQLVARGSIDPQKPAELVQQCMAELQQVLDSLHPEEDLEELHLEAPPPGAARRVKTAIPVQRLRDLNKTLYQFPKEFKLHPRLERIINRRRTMLDNPEERVIDWGAAESLAFASILENGISIRITGQDVERGTFSHRHGVLHDVETGQTLVPLQALPQAKVAFEIHNSPLSENAALGFEYGYNVQAPSRLVIWEAQYGDFINGAQVIVDQFITTARAKWEQTPSLVLLLPHGYEGQGPEHSSARLEYFLRSAAETNMRIANCTTAAQYFHLLRRQAALLEVDPLPLVVLTPKSLLRHPQAASSLRELSEGGWQPVIDDSEARTQADKVERLILCSGKVYIDLVTHAQHPDNPAIAIARVEQLYPLPTTAIQHTLEGYPHLKEIVWLQEEPQNMGAWEFMESPLLEILQGRWPLRYIGRPRRASPAEGSQAWHQSNQAAIVEKAYEM
ncbi:MAG: 2-oxoglutarate dehydrogenase E1 component [Chloroflexi bacterium]|nr:2-oxoglutarate dehydrogenase E1 component [Chloroflexota bacterium]